MKKTPIFSTLFMMIAFGHVLWGQLLNENFQYAAGDNLTDHGWSAFESSGTNPIMVSSSGLSFTDYASSGIGNAALLDTTGEDDKKGFTEQTSGTVYASFLVNVATDGAYAGYFFHFRKSTANKARVFVKKVSNKLEFGLKKSGDTGNYTTNGYSFDTTYLLVLKYEFKAGSGDDEVSLFVFSSGEDFSSEPGTPTLGPDTVGTDFTGIDYVALRQYKPNQNITVDGIRVGTSWSDAPLPVELTSFTARQEGSAVVLEWVTESEIENLGFIIERRSVSEGSFGGDGEQGSGGEWKEIASYITHPELQGQGSVTYRTEYSYTDNTVETGKTYDYRLADVSYEGVKEYHTMTVLGVTVTEVIPDKFTLYPAYPNPFNSETTISFDLPEAQQVTVTVYDLTGREVATLTNREYSAGSHSVIWDAGDFGSGVYVYRLNAGSFVSTGKLVLVK
ncbi:MAG: T9SS type A sorting domain-containing protein [Candidatus Marinimicrobia bacterium]|nr:T9SS type A sorting domain-containing protein [Candidatus Neomarinimicrobiota bacterium]